MVSPASDSKVLFSPWIRAGNNVFYSRSTSISLPRKASVQKAIFGDISSEELRELVDEAKVKDAANRKRTKFLENSKVMLLLFHGWILKLLQCRVLRWSRRRSIQQLNVQSKLVKLLMLS